MAGKPQHDYAAICADYRSGMGYKAIAAKHRTTRPTVCRAISRLIGEDERNYLRNRRLRDGRVLRSRRAQAEKVESGCFEIVEQENAIVVRTQGVTFTFDPDVRDLLLRYCWRVAPDNRLTRQVAEGRSRNIYIYHDILGVEPSEDVWVDHINGDARDNRRENLRLSSPRQNSWNKRPKAGKFKGVFARRKRFVARIKVGSKIINLGGFATAHEAADAYDAAAAKYFGEFAWLNREHFMMPTATNGQNPHA